MKVMVRLPREERRSEFDVEELRLRAPSGALVPLSRIAHFQRGRAPTTIKREEGKRIVNVSATLSSGARSARPVLESLRKDALPKLQKSYPRLEVKLVGQQRAQREAFKSLRQNFGLALFVIFALLAVPFKSYTQPLIVMAAIPFGIVGAIFGHLVMGFSLSIISMFGIIALSGVVVNDSLVLIDAANRAQRGG